MMMTAIRKLTETHQWIMIDTGTHTRTQNRFVPVHVTLFRAPKLACPSSNHQLMLSNKPVCTSSCYFNIWFIPVRRIP